MAATYVPLSALAVNPFIITNPYNDMGPNKIAVTGNQPQKETRAERAAREKREMKFSSDRKIAIRKLTKAITESDLSANQIDKLHEQFKEVTV